MSETSAERMLRLIKALNQSGPSTVVALQRQTNISRPALYRLLDVLVQYGYAERSQDRHRFQLTSIIRELSDGVRDDDRITAAAGPILTRLQQSLVWPASLAVFDGGTMIIKLTTRSSSPLVFDRARVGERVPVLGTAMGTAYLAFASPPVRRTIIDMLSKSDDPRCRLAKAPARLKRILRAAVEAGYAVRNGGTIANTASIAVPLLLEGHAVGSIVVSFLSSAMPIHQAVSRFLAPLQGAARDIARRAGATPRRRLNAPNKRAA